MMNDAYGSGIREITAVGGKGGVTLPNGFTPPAIGKGQLRRWAAAPPGQLCSRQTAEAEARSLK